MSVHPCVWGGEGGSGRWCAHTSRCRGGAHDTSLMRAWPQPSATPRVHPWPPAEALPRPQQAASQPSPAQAAPHRTVGATELPQDAASCCCILHTYTLHTYGHPHTSHTPHPRSTCHPGNPACSTGAPPRSRRCQSPACRRAVKNTQGTSVTSMDMVC